MARTITFTVALASAPLILASALLAAPIAAGAYGPSDLISVGNKAKYTAFSPDGQNAWVTNQNSDSVSLIDVEQGTEVAEIPVGNEPVGIAVLPSRNEVWVAVWGSATATDITIIDTDDLSTTTISSGGNGPYAIEFDNTGAFAYVSNYFSGGVAKIDTGSRTVVDTAAAFSFPEGLTLSADGQTLYVAETNADYVSRFTTSGLDPIGSPISVGDFPIDPALSPDGSEIWVTNNGSHTVSVISTVTNTVTNTIAVGADPIGIAFDVDGFVWVAAAEDDVLQRIDPETYAIVSAFPMADGLFGITSHPTKRLLYVSVGNHVATVELTTHRVAGADRYATAVELSKTTFAPDVDTVYVATGLNYPDALAAGAVAAKVGAPILLTRPDSLPTVVAEELTRLSPTKIVVLGGPTTVSTTVEGQLAAYGSVSRIAGVNRYETSRLLVESANFAGVDHIYIATGTNFPDALAAGAAAANTGSPVVLVPGASSTLDAATLELIGSTGAATAVILGAENAVSFGIESQLSAEGYDVARFAGANRYETSVQVSGYSFSGAETALLATGLNFPDALAGTPTAAAAHAPLFVVQSDCVPTSVLRMFDQLGTRHVVLLGGTPTLTVAVEDLTACA